MNRSKLKWNLNLVSSLALVVLPLAAASATEPADAVPKSATRSSVGDYSEWKNFGIADGLPATKVQAVCIARDGVWVGTEKGAAVLRGGRWKVFGVREGLCHPVVFCIAEDPVTGEIWFGTAGGLTRRAQGRTDVFTQLNSGLANDVIYGLAVHRGSLWAATAAGCSRFDSRSGSWTIFNEKNTPMHEIWCYGVSASGSTVFLAVWGGGLLEYSIDRDLWKEYRDPDREMEIDLFRNDGLVHDVVSAVWYGGKKVWVATYFGVSSYDGRRWRSYMEDDSGLASNFVNYVEGRGDAVWFCTDRGLSRFDGKVWTTYSRRDDGTGSIVHGHGPSRRESRTTQSLAGNSVVAIDFQGDDLWVATESGLSRGRRRQAEPSLPAAGGSP